MKNHPFKVVARILFLAVVVGICVFSLVDLIETPLDYLKLSIVAIGLLGVILTISGQRVFSLFLWTWIILQFFQVERIVNNEASTLLDLHLAVSYSYPFEVAYQGIQYVLNINLLPLVFIPFMFSLSQSQLVGQEFMLKPFRDNNWLAEKMPQVVKVLDEVNFSGNRKWVLVHLSKGITYDNQKYFHALLKAKDYVSIRKRNSRQIVHFRLFDGHNNPGKSLKEFPFIDWVVLE